MQAVRDARGSAIVSFRVIDASDRCFKMLNMTRENLMGKLLTELPPEQAGDFPQRSSRKSWRRRKTNRERIPDRMAGPRSQVDAPPDREGGRRHRDFVTQHHGAENLGANAASEREGITADWRIPTAGCSRKVNHRVRNNLATLLAMVSMLRRRHISRRLPLRRTWRGKLRSMTQIHNTMADADWQSVGLESLARRILASMKSTGEHAVTIDVSGPPVELASNQCHCRWR